MSFHILNYHLIWGTKLRLPTITKDVEPVLFRLLRQICDDHKVHVHALNGWEDHVHLVVHIPPTLALADLMNRLKGKSSYVLTHQHGSELYWQRGYSAFTLSESVLPVVVEYVLNQKQHHGQNTLIDAYERLDVIRHR